LLRPDRSGVQMLGKFVAALEAKDGARAVDLVDLIDPTPRGPSPAALVELWAS
jgi:hypothetical protein